MSRRSLLDIGKTLLHDIRDGELRIARPDWRNPFSSEGAGLEFVSKLPFDELIGRHRDLLIALTHYAHYLRVYAPAGSDMNAETAEPLGANRDPTDMIWHTDRVHRDDGAVTVILGQSPIATGIAQKSDVAKEWLKRIPGFLSFFSWAEELRREANGESATFSDDFGMQRMFEAHKEQGVDTSLSHPFWDGVADVNAHVRAEWIGMAPSECADFEQGVFVSKGVYHNRARVQDILELNGRQKRRIELKPDADLRAAIDRRVAHLSAAAEASIDVDWLRRLA